MGAGVERCKIVIAYESAFASAVSGTNASLGMISEAAADTKSITCMNTGSYAN